MVPFELNTEGHRTSSQGWQTYKKVSVKRSSFGGNQNISKSVESILVVMVSSLFATYITEFRYNKNVITKSPANKIA
jgi:hypothetical protein